MSYLRYLCLFADSGVQHCVVFLFCLEFFSLSESHAIINDLDVILHVFMLQIIYTTEIIPRFSVV